MKKVTGRVIEVQRTHMTVETHDGETLKAGVRGQFHAAGEYPKVGDVVDVSLDPSGPLNTGVIERIHPRRSVIERYEESSQSTQVLAANVDLLCIVMGLDGDFNLSRLDRYLALARQSNITPVIVLNKEDVTNAAQAAADTVQEMAIGVDVLVMSADTGKGISALIERLRPNRTAVLLGSSGVGKSTITNQLLGESRQAVQPVRPDDSRGCHTTTTRQLFRVPTGGYIIDTPGIRELAIPGVSASDEAVFLDIDELSAQCRFRNCDHHKSAGCAVLQAVKDGELAEKRWRNYQKLRREQRWQSGHETSGRHAEQITKRGAQARAAAERRRLSRR